MEYIRDKVLAPVAGQLAKHTPTEVGNKAVEAAGIDNVAETMGKYLGPEASVQMLDTAGPEHLADILGPKYTAQLLIDTLKMGEPQSQQLLSAIGPQRMAVMLSRLGLTGAVQCVSAMGPANTAAVTILELGPENGALLFKHLGVEFTAGLVSGLGPSFVGEMLKVPGHVKTGVMMSNMEPHFTAAIFKTTGPSYLGLMYKELHADYAGSMMAAAGGEWVVQLFKYLGPPYLADFMRQTGPDFQADMLRVMGLETSAKVFEGAGAEFMAVLLQSVGPQFNAVLVRQLGTGATTLGLDLGAGFLADVAVHSSPGFLASLMAATTSEVVVPAVSTAVGDAVTAATDALTYLAVADHHHDDYHPDRHQQAGPSGTTAPTGTAPTTSAAVPASSLPGGAVLGGAGLAPTGNISRLQSNTTHSGLVSRGTGSAQQPVSVRPVGVPSSGASVRNPSGVSQGQQQDEQAPVKIAAIPLSRADVAALQEQKLQAEARAPDAALAPAGAQL